MGATFYVSGMDAYTRTDWQTLRAIKGHGFEIGFNGLARRRAREATMSLDDSRRMDPVPYDNLEEWYKDEVEAGLRLLKWHGIRPVNYAYPFDSHSDESDVILLERFNTLRLGVPNVYKGGILPRLFGSVDFGREPTHAYCGQERVVKAAIEMGGIVAVHMREPLRNRLEWLYKMKREHGLAVTSVERAYGLFGGQACLSGEVRSADQ